MSQELEEGKCSYQGRSVNIFAMYTQKSAEVIVDDLPYELKDMSVEVFRLAQ